MASEFDNTAKLLENGLKLFKETFNVSATTAACGPGRALPMGTVVVGAKKNSGLCRVLSAAENIAGPKMVEFEVPTADTPLDPGEPKWANYVKGVVAHFPGKLCPYEAVILSSVPLGGGVSSSASLEVAMFTFLESLTGHTASSAKEKALLCQKAEHTHAGVPCGIMDQFISVMGKDGHALLLDCRAMEGEQIVLDDPAVSVLITNSNVRHELTGGEYSSRRQQCEAAAQALGVQSLRDVTLQQLQDNEKEMDHVVFRRARHVIGEIERCVKAAHALKTGDVEQFGKLMLASHESLRDDFEVSCAELDQLVSAAMSAPGGVVYGSRMTGGGFGGCTVTLLRTEAAADVIEHIQSKYDGTATFFICKPAGGASVLKV